MAYKATILVALLGVGVALFFTLDVFEPERKEILKYLPNELTQIITGVSENVAVGDKEVDKKKTKLKERVFTKTELSEYDGSKDHKKIYLSIMGKVYDVTKGDKHYGPGGGYHFFTGKDGSKAFVTGEFNEDGLTDNIEGISPQDALGLEDWVQFYSKTYKYLGKLDGYFYDENGAPREGYYLAEELTKTGHKLKAGDEADEKLFPPCNSEWSREKGGRVYCSKNSGGIARDWEGVPRKYFRPGKKDPRCACIRTTGPPSDNPGSSTNRGNLDNPNLKQYPNCPPTSISCKIEN